MSCMINGVNFVEVSQFFSDNGMPCSVDPNKEVKTIVGYNKVGKWNYWYLCIMQLQCTFNQALVASELFCKNELEKATFDLLHKEICSRGEHILSMGDGEDYLYQYAKIATEFEYPDMYETQLYVLLKQEDDQIFIFTRPNIS